MWCVDLDEGLDVGLGEYVDDLLGALLRAQTAVLALVRVDDGVVVDDVDGIELALLLAELAADAAGGAGLGGVLALVGGVAAYVDALDVGYDVDDLLWADACAHAAAYADFSVDSGKAVADLDGTVGAGPLAVAEAYASVLAYARASEEAFDSGAGLKTLVIHLFLGGVAVARAAHIGDLLDDVQGLLAEYRRRPPERTDST